MDLEGNKYGKLTVVGRAAELVRKDAWWVCECVCGRAIVSSSSHLKSGHTSSCGCENARQWRGEKAPQYKHGKRHSAEWRTWSNMKNRCMNPNYTKWDKYGGRGIKVCERWMNSFENFYNDMGDKPSPLHSIDRINNDGDYEPSNCRWTTDQTQANNKSNNYMVTIGGVTDTLPNWCRNIGVVSRKMAYRRIFEGWDVEKAIKTPPINKPIDK
jgi:hypothetical protein